MVGCASVPLDDVRLEPLVDAWRPVECKKAVAKPESPARAAGSSRRFSLKAAKRPEVLLDVRVGRVPLLVERAPERPGHGPAAGSSHDSRAVDGDPDSLGKAASHGPAPAVWNGSDYFVSASLGYEVLDVSSQERVGGVR